MVSPWRPQTDSRPSAPGVQLRAPKPLTVVERWSAQEKSAAATRCDSPPLSVRSRASAPTELRASTSRRRRTAEYPIAGSSPSSASWRIWKAPISVAPSLPVTRAPPRIGRMSPSEDRPMRRLKNSAVSRGSNGRVRSPTSKSPAFSRKNSRFSGKNNSKRVRLTCCSSASTWAKSVFSVRSRFRLELRAILASSPPLGTNSRSTSSPSVRPATPNGLSLTRPPGSARSIPVSPP